MAALWKGGWGPGTDGKYLVRQMGQVTVGDEKLAISYAVIPGDGAFESGQSDADEVAQWLVDHAPAGQLPGDC